MRSPEGAAEWSTAGSVAFGETDRRAVHLWGDDDITPAPARSRRPMALVAGALVLSGLLAIELVFQWGGVSLADRWLDDLGELAAALAAGIVALGRGRASVGSRRRAWGWLGASCLAWALGETIWSWYDLVLRVTIPFPSPADVGFLLACPTAILGVLTYLAPSASRAHTRMLLDGLITAGALLFISWVVVLGPTAHANSGHPLAEVIGLAYPVSDVISVTVALQALGRARGATRRTLLLIGAGMIGLGIADSSFSYLDGIGSYGSGSPTDAAWVCGFLLIGVAALTDTSTRNELADDRPNVVQAVIPYVVVVPAAVVALVAGGTAKHLSPFTVCEGLLVLLLLVGRQVVTIRQNVYLVARLERTVSELHVREQQLLDQAAHDPLTGLVNRSSVDRCVAAALEHHRLTRRPVAVLMCDLDRFKLVNDTLGHSAGDRALVEAALRLVRASRTEDIVGRVGGDEFVVVVKDLPAVGAAEALAARLASAFETPFELGGRSFTIGVSIGLAVLDGAGPVPASGDELLGLADRALYEAKAAGRGGWIRSGDDRPDFLPETAPDPMGTV